MSINKSTPVTRPFLERIRPDSLEVGINSRNLLRTEVSTSTPQVPPYVDPTFVIMFEDLTIADQGFEGRPDTAPRVFLDTLDSNLNSSYYSSLYSIPGTVEYVLVYESESYDGRTPRTIGADGWPIINLEDLIYVLENKYGVVPNSPTPKWVLLDYENPFTWAIGYGIAAGTTTPNDTVVKGPVNRRATQILTDLINGLKAHFGTGARFTVYGHPFLANYTQGSVAPQYFENGLWLFADEENRQARMNLAVIQEEDILKVLDWYPGYGWDWFPRQQSLVESGGTVLQRSNTHFSGGIDLTGRFTELSRACDDFWVSSLKVLDLVPDQSTVDGKPVIPFINCDLYRDGWHWRIEPTFDGPRRVQFIPNDEFLDMVLYTKQQLPRMKGICLWSVIDFWSRCYVTSQPPIRYPSTITDRVLQDYSETMRASVVRNFFGGIDPVATTQQFPSWTDPALKSLYAVRYNDKVLSLLDSIARETSSYSSFDTSKTSGFSCYTTNSGEVRCFWNRAYNLSIGFEDSGQTDVPEDLGQVDVPSEIPRCKQVVCGYKHTLALTIDGKVIAWGSDDVGQGKTGTQKVQEQLTAAGKTVTKIACGAHHNLALLNTGEVIVWGRNESAQMSDPDLRWTGLGYQSQTDPLFRYCPELSSLYDCDVDPNGCHRLYRGANQSQLLNDQRQVNLNGYSSGGESPYRVGVHDDCLGEGVTGGRPTVVDLGWDSTTNAPYDYQFSRSTVGEVSGVNYSFGGSWQRSNDVFSLLGVSSKRYTDIAAGRAHNILLTTDGNIEVWGQNWYYQVTGSGDHYLDGRGVCDYSICGNPSTWNAVDCANCYKRSGSGDPASTTNPQKWGDGTARIVRSLKTTPFGVSKIGAAYYNSAVIKSASSNYDLYVWDRNDYGQSNPLTGLPVSDLNNPFVEISGGYRHFCARRANGTVVCWGDNGNGQCTVPAGITATSIHCGKEYTLAVLQDRTVTGWGKLDQVGGTAALAAVDFSSGVLPFRSAVVSTGFVQTQGSDEGIDEGTSFPGSFDETA